MENIRAFGQLEYMKFGLFNKNGELVIATESGEKAHEIAKIYSLELKEIK